MPIDRFFLFLRTVYFLKPIQVRYRIYYFLKNRIALFLDKRKTIDQVESSKILRFTNPLTASTSYFKKGSFTFLNLNVVFKNEVDWNYNQNGKLWTYNLSYFDFLLQEKLLKDEALVLMRGFAKEYDRITDGLEPYPTSVRIINWVKYLSIQKLQEDELDRIIYSDLVRLSKNVEYHLLGNHLLENAFALLFGGVYFQDVATVQQAGKILEAQLNEQILADGGHFELSPMYHQIMLARLLDGINLLMNNAASDRLLMVLQAKAELMLGWIEEISFSDGSTPNINDSTGGVAPSTFQIRDYAHRLSVKKLTVSIKECGYRKFVNGHYESIVDVGNIGPDYIPGHAHSDTFNILLNYQQHQVLVDTGISTYEKNETRQNERCTKAHNTVTISGHDQSEVWGGFRVGRRAKSIILKEAEQFIAASHDGYDRFGVVHTRSFEFKDEKIVLIDQLNRKSEARAYFHFHPDMKVSHHGNVVRFQFGQIAFENLSELKIGRYEYAVAFNKRRPAQLLEVSFEKTLTTTISFDEATKNTILHGQFPSGE